MTRYIDADALLQKVGFLEGRVVGVYKSDILAAPTADVVEVVRCKECCYCDDAMRCQNEHSAFRLIREDNDFCSYGARMDKEASHE